jgi:hypothetical protein
VQVYSEAVKRLYLLAPLALIVLGCGAIGHVLTTLPGAWSLTDTPEVLEAGAPLPARVAYVRLLDARLRPGSITEVRVTRSVRRGGRSEQVYDHSYFRSTIVRNETSEPLLALTSFVPTEATQWTGVYRTDLRALVVGLPGAEVATAVHQIVGWALVVIALGAIALGVGLAGERRALAVTRTSAGTVQGFRSSARSDEVRVLEKRMTTAMLTSVISAAGASFAVTIFFAYLQLDGDPHVRIAPSETLSFMPLFALPVLAYVALHERATITFRRGLVERRGALGWTKRAVLEGAVECVIRPAVTMRRSESLEGLPFAVEIRHDGGKLWLARVEGESAARELASEVNRLLAEVHAP